MGTPTATYKEDRFSLLNALSDPDLLKERVKELREAEESAEKVIALVAPASELLDMKKKTDQERNKQKKIKDKCDSLMTEAENKAASIMQAAKEEKKRMESRAKELDQVKGNLDKQRSQIKESLRDIDKRSKSLDKRESKLKSDRKLLSDDKDSLAGLRDTIQTYLAKEEG